jgi:hypothetical protein
MRLSPEVSTGQINEQGLPESQTTEVESHIILPDGQGMVVGGLIRENFADRQAKLPYLGDVKWVGKLFQRRQVSRNRTEVIIAVIPRIVPYDCQTAERDREELARTDAPIFTGSLSKNFRPLEPRLWDACENPRPLRPHDPRMNPRRPKTVIPYPSDPASRACLDDDGVLGPNRPNCPPPLSLPTSEAVEEILVEPIDAQPCPVDPDSPAEADSEFTPIPRGFYSNP